MPGLDIWVWWDWGAKDHLEISSPFLDWQIPNHWRLSSKVSSYMKPCENLMKLSSPCSLPLAPQKEGVLPLFWFPAGYCSSVCWLEFLSNCVVITCIILASSKCLVCWIKGSRKEDIGMCKGSGSWKSGVCPRAKNAWDGAQGVIGNKTGNSGWGQAMKGLICYV